MRYISISLYGCTRLNEGGILDFVQIDAVHRRGKRSPGRWGSSRRWFWDEGFLGSRLRGNDGRGGEQGSRRWFWDGRFLDSRPLIRHSRENGNPSSLSHPLPTRHPVYNSVSIRGDPLITPRFGLLSLSSAQLTSPPLDSRPLIRHSRENGNPSSLSHPLPTRHPVYNSVSIRGDPLITPRFGLLSLPSAQLTSPPLDSRLRGKGACAHFRFEERWFWDEGFLGSRQAGVSEGGK